MKKIKFQVSISLILFTGLFLFSGCEKYKEKISKDFRPLIFIPDIHKDKQIYEADSLDFTGNTETAILIFKSSSETSGSVYAKYRLLMCYIELYRQQESDSLYKALVDRVETDNILIFIRNLALDDYYFRFYPRKCDIERLHKLKSLSINDYYLKLLLNKIGRYYLTVRFELDSAWHYYQGSWSKRSEFLTLNDADCLSALSEMCTYKRKNLLAIGYANRMADFEQYYFAPNDMLKCNAYTTRAYLLFRDGDMTGSLSDLEDALSLTDSINNPAHHQEVLKTGLVLYMIKEDSLKTLNFHKRLQNFIKESGKDYINLYRFSGRLAEESGQTEKSIELLQNALNYEKESGYERLAVISNLCHILSYAYENQKKYDKALGMMAHSRNTSVEFEWDTFMEFVRNDKLYSYVPALRCAEIYFHKYENSKFLNDLLYAEKLIATIDSLMPAQWDVGEENAILQFYLESGSDFYKSAIRIYYELYKITGDTKWEDLFFSYCEKNKNSLLVRDYLLAGKYASIPENLIEKERNLKAMIKKAQLKGLRNNAEFVQFIEEYEKLEQILEKDYPGYMENPLISHEISRSEMQKKLTVSQCIIHYNEVDNELYTGILNSDVSYIYRVKPDNKLLNQMDSISSYHKGEILFHPADYQRIASEVFNTLFDESARKLLKEEWMVVPDGNLFRFPLSALIDKTTADFSKIQDLNLIIQKYKLSYVPAIRILPDETKTIQINPESVAVFAFSDKTTIASKQRASLHELPGTYLEAKKLKNMYSGAKIFTGKKATKENFLKMYSDPSIQYIHLAVHGLANSNVKDDVKLYFRTSTGGIDSLYGYELLSVRSKVKKVVLSACQSGLGSYQKGEGTYSLPRYFIINGATDVTASLWDFDDRFNPELPSVGMVRWGW